MSGYEFAAIWAVALTVSALTVGWAFLVQTFGISPAPTVALGVVVPLAVVMAALWAVVRR